MKNTPLDPASLKILAELQKNGRVSSNELAEKIGMSASPCWRRQKELEENGYIVRYAALLDRRKLGLAVVCLLHITLLRHAEGVVEQFEEAMRLRPEVVECYETTGSSDYMVKVVVADMDAYHDFLHNVLVKLNGVAQVNTSVALREVKYDTNLPLHAAGL
ncbi:Lrp/AsnC family transcriptional regulator [Massilia sp. HP4]|uniref:Lrp/AsnC family transcriptional regulator n=1 Tax=Massilia sp. HP4 TaxID=2562316 RepID=UPI0010BF911A|nr:Lrp/AsnC family transcriptional regulator [Massilia sp. HP4]